MRRLHNSRAPEPDESAIEGFDRVELEGDPIVPVVDEIPWLRPLGSDLPGPPLTLAAEAAENEATRVIRQARELCGLSRRLDAILLLRRHLDEAPGDAAARGLFAELLEQAGEVDAALEELGRALSAAADPVPLLVRRGELFAWVGRPAEAERDLRDAIRRRREHAPAHYQLGITLLRRGRAADAAEALREALRWSPEDPQATYYLGEALQRQGDLRGALDALERAAALAPADPRSYQLMGRLLDRLGQGEAAMAMHKKAREATIR